jgi:hypothetical protein
VHAQEHTAKGSDGGGGQQGGQLSQNLQVVSNFGNIDFGLYGNP